MDSIQEITRSMIERRYVKAFLFNVHVWELINAPIVLGSMPPRTSMTDIARQSFDRKWRQAQSNR